MGMTGASYGGGIQLVTAGIDCRVDAIAPIIAWNSLENSLFRNQVPKQGWSSILSKSAALGSLDPHITSAYESTIATGTISEEDQVWFRSRAPGDLVSKVKVPTLLVQGMTDTLFSLDEGIANYKVIEKSGVPLAMVWTCGGHGICNAKKGDPERASNRVISWLQRYVRNNSEVDTGPAFDAIDQDGVRHTADTYPTNDGEPFTAEGDGTLQLTADGGSVPPAEAIGSSKDPVETLAAGIMPFKAKNAVNVEIDGADRDAMILGAPTLKLTYSGSVEDGPRPTAAFAQLIDDSTGDVIGQQITPIALTLDGAPHTAELPIESVMFHLKPGNTVTLQLVANSSAYATPRLGGQVEFTKIGISLPTTTQLRSPR
jgi:ABC-2 type transport system ATP-binding protein